VIRRIVAFFDEREAPTALVLIRVFLAVCLLVDLTWVGIYDLQTWLWAPISDGGTSAAIQHSTPYVYSLFGLDAGTAMLIWVGLMISAFTFGVGFFTRTSALFFAVLYAQSAMANDYGDRGIDRMIRIVVLILAFSECGRAYSVDAWIKFKNWRGNGQPVLAWPRYLILGQLVLMYCAAGFSKGGTLWFPWGGYAALYVILQDPIYAIYDFSFLAHPFWYFLTQLGTAGTHIWEMAAPIVLLTAWYKRTADRPGRVRAWFNRMPVRTVYVLCGVGFHLILAFTVRIGIFPWAMLAFYPAFYTPAELDGMLAKLRARIFARRAAIG
jgi:hypothetical protein